MKSVKPVNWSKKWKWWESLSAEEQIYIKVGTAALITAITTNRPARYSSKFTSLIRAQFHQDPHLGGYVRKGRGKYGYNL